MNVNPLRKLFEQVMGRLEHDRQQLHFLAGYGFEHPGGVTMIFFFCGTTVVFRFSPLQKKISADECFLMVEKLKKHEGGGISSLFS